MGSKIDRGVRKGLFMAAGLLMVSLGLGISSGQGSLAFSEGTNPNKLALAGQGASTEKGSLAERTGFGADEADLVTARAAAYPESAIIDNGTVQLGVMPSGNLNAPGGTPSSGEGTEFVGLRFVPTNADSTSPGCLCEGWGVASGSADGPGTNVGVRGFANEDRGGPYRLRVLEFSNDADSALSVVEVLGGESNQTPIMKVTHQFEPFTGSPNLYKVDVAVENLTGEPIKDLLYRRVMDWDIEPTAFSEYATIDGDSDSEFLRFTSDDGFAGADPLSGPSSINETGFFTDSGPDDHGALFDFGFGALAPLETRTFSIFYGAAPDEASAVSAVAAAQAEVWSFGQASTPDGPDLGTPNTFIFAFSGVGGGGSAADARPPVTLSTKGRNRLSVGQQSFDVEATLENTGAVDIEDGSLAIDPGSELSLTGGDTPHAVGTLLANSANMPGTSWTLETPPPLCDESKTYEYSVTGDFQGSGAAGGLRQVQRSVTVPRTCGSIQGNVFWELGGGDSSGPEAGARLALCPAPGFSGDCQTAITDSDGQYGFSEVEVGSYEIVARPNPGGPRPDLPQAKAAVTVASGGSYTQNFLLKDLIVPPPNVALSTASGGSLPATDDGYPRVFWSDAYRLSVNPECAASEASYRVVQGSPVVVTLSSGPMEKQADGSFAVTMPPLSPSTGYATVEFNISCDDLSSETVSFSVYIDPSGYVNTVEGQPVANATVTLLRSSSVGGPFSVVPDGDTIMSPSNRTNPDQTDAGGHFGWDVVEGFYKVKAEKAGCRAPGNPGQAFVETVVYEIPPPVTDIDLRLDCSPPDTTIDSGPSGTIGADQATFAFSGSPAVITAKVQCKIDAEAFADCSSPKVFSGLADGEHTVSFRAEDITGNQDLTPATRTFTVDTTPPDTTIDAGPTGTIDVDEATFAFSGDPAGDTAKIQCRIDDDPFADCSSPRRFNGLAEGSHTVAFRAEDVVGNQDPTPAVRDFTVDLGPTPACVAARASLKSAGKKRSAAVKKLRAASKAVAKAKRALKKAKKSKKAPKIRAAKKKIKAAKGKAKKANATVMKRKRAVKAAKSRVAAACD